MPTETATKEHRSSGIMVTAPWRTRSVTVLADYCLSVTCNDGTTGTVDMSQLIFSEKAGIYSTLKDAQLFNQACIELGVFA